MFGSDDIELDFDDDFSCNLFSNRVATGKGDEGKRDRVPESVPGRGLRQSPGELLRGESKPSSGTSAGDAFNWAPRVSPSESSLKRPLLLDEGPQKKRLSHEALLPRKFPGPAGLLPDKPFKHISDLALPPEELQEEQQSTSQKDKCIVLSQSSGSVFLDSGYQKLVTDFSLGDSANPLNKYTVEWVKRTALSKGLQGRKIPFLGLVIHTVNHSMPDPLLILRDPTGEISGSLHREVWAEMGPKLRAGIALALRQVGVLITGVIRRQIYLNITMNNILAVYRPSESEREVEITRVNKVSQSELVRSLGEWATGPRAAPRAPPSPCAPFPFTSIDDRERSVGRGQKVNGGDGGDGGDGGRKGGETVREGDRGVVSRAGGLSGGLTPAESLIFEEVLSGIDLDEFEM